jgi:hypothetical protein
MAGEAASRDADQGGAEGALDRLKPSQRIARIGAERRHRCAAVGARRTRFVDSDGAGARGADVDSDDERISAN